MAWQNSIGCQSWSWGNKSSIKKFPFYWPSYPIHEDVRSSGSNFKYNCNLHVCYLFILCILLINEHLFYNFGGLSAIFLLDKIFEHPYTKVTGCLCVCGSMCLFVPKDLPNRWTDGVLLNRVASHMSRKGL